MRETVRIIWLAMVISAAWAGCNGDDDGDQEQDAGGGDDDDDDSQDIDTDPNLTCEGDITFPDPNLYAKVRTAVNKPTGDISHEDLLKLQAFDGSMSDISNLTNMHCMGNLTGLMLRVNRIGDLSPLSGLTELTTLILWSNEIADITPLSDMVELKELRLSANKIDNIGPLADLAALEVLTLANNLIIELSPVKHLVNLNELELDANRIADIEPLVDNIGLGQGDTVNISGNKIDCEDPDTLDHITALEQRGVILTHDCQKF